MGCCVGVSATPPRFPLQSSAFGERISASIPNARNQPNQRTMTNKEQAANAVKWVNNLTRYKKTTGQLGAIDDEGVHRYCCLGVGCKVVGVTPNDWNDGFETKLTGLLGLFDERGTAPDQIEGEDHLANVNDELFPSDEGFHNMKRVIAENYKKVFRPGVARYIMRKGKGLALRAS